MKKIIAIFFLFISVVIKGEEKKLDSLYNVFQNASHHDTIRFYALGKIFHEVIITNQDSAFKIAVTQGEFAKQNKLIKHQGYALLNKARAKVSQGFTEEGIKFYEEAKSYGYKHSLNKVHANATYSLGINYKNIGNVLLARKYLEETFRLAETYKLDNLEASAYMGLGNLYKNIGDIPAALKYLTKATTLKEKLGHRIHTAIGYTNLGNIFRSQGDLDAALKYHLKAFEIRDSLDNEQGLSNSYLNIGVVYQQKKEFEKAKSHFKASVLLCEQQNNLKRLASCYHNLGEIAFLENDIELSKQYHEKALEIRKKISFKEGLAYSYVSIGKIVLSENNLSKALKYGNTALVLAKEIEDPDRIKQAAKLLKDVYLKKGNAVKAVEMMELFVQMKDSILNEANLIETKRYQMQYEHDKELLSLEKEKEVQNAIFEKEKSRKNIILVSILLGLGIVVIFSLFLFNRFQLIRKQKNVIEQAHGMLEEKTQEILDSIAYAKRIQTAILPPKKIVKEYLNNSFIYYQPKDIVAGDFYWLEHKENKVLFAAADCTGHGVPGAMVSVICNNGLNRSVREYGLTDPGEILNKTREIVIQEFEKSEEEVKDGMDIALCSLEGNTLRYAGAHNPLWIIRNQELIETKANKQPIGKFDNPEPYTTHTLELQKGDSIYIFSDGYADQFGGEKGKKLKTANFKKLLFSIQDQPMDKQRKLIEEAFEKWKGNLEQLDDVCVIGVKI